MIETIKFSSVEDHRLRQITNSALWAAAGDALGWITELGDEQAVRRRAKSAKVTKTVEWKRRIGGKFGPTVTLPEGAISDDTQLRLAVSRSIRSNGEFDVETFAKVELPVWMSYSLGAGRGTTAAASNLSKSSAAWFSNFFGKPGERGNYFVAGGNGAAMRIQPHVWKSVGLGTRSYLRDVFRDSIVTHGSPRGFMGAIFHAMCLDFALLHLQAPGPEEWISFASDFQYVPELVQNDDQLSLFWLAPWQKAVGTTLDKAVADEAKLVLDFANWVKNKARNGLVDYHDAVSFLGGFNDETRGAGLNTALAAACLCYSGRSSSNADTILVGVNTIGSDTDTIASMAGSILGAARPEPMPWTVQDKEYIIFEAKRMALICAGKPTQTIPYPNLMTWGPPSTQIDAVGTYEGEIFLAGLGQLSEIGERYVTSEAEWQWYRLPWGQSILAKQRAKKRHLSNTDIPDARAIGAPTLPENQLTLFRSDPRNAASERSSTSAPKSRDSDQVKAGRTMPEIKSDLPIDLDELSGWVIDQNFSPSAVGAALISIASGPNGMDRSIAFSAIIAKAIRTRQRRASR